MVFSYVCLLIFSAELKCFMLFGTEKYSGSAMKAGFCWAALRIAVAGGFETALQGAADFHVD